MKRNTLTDTQTQQITTSRPSVLDWTLLIVLLMMTSDRFLVRADTIATHENPVDSGKKTPLEIYILAGQSNMVGMGSMKHLDELVQVNCTSHCKPHNEYRQRLWDEHTASYKVSNNVYINFESRHGPLTVGYGAKNRMGPELMFGWNMGRDAQRRNKDQKVLLIKEAWGGKDLGVDFRPPLSGEGTYENRKPIQYGQYYRRMVTETLEILNNLTAVVPTYKEEDGYELKGFVWFQGWNDLVQYPMVDEYQYNLANLIRDVRKDFDAPNLPFIVGELGMHGPHPTGKAVDRILMMRSAERNVTLFPEFRNSTLFVPTSPYAVLNGTTYNGVYHYNGRADTYFHIGEAFANGMLALLNKTHSNNPTEWDAVKAASNRWRRHQAAYKSKVFALDKGQSSQH